MSNRSLFSRLITSIWNLFLNGLLAILPFVLTITLFTMLGRFTISWLEPIQQLISPTILEAVPYAHVILMIVIIFFIGTLYNIVILRLLIKSIENIFFRMPLIRPVYIGIKQLVHAFSLQDKLTFKQVVLTEFPRKGIYSLGFLTSEVPSAIAPDKKEKYYNVYIPTTPNPTSGYCIIVPKNEVIMVDLTRQEAMAMIISGGIIQPERLVKKHN